MDSGSVIESIYLVQEEERHVEYVHHSHRPHDVGEAHDLHEVAADERAQSVGEGHGSLRIRVLCHGVLVRHYVVGVDFTTARA